ncbi:hypothetical protein [uncultured Paracoccus sp.]|uniref:hypothetical protein n=1 Tax=uncultured Paracoccus sp. TaxID=189685 RepID=UPI00262E4603|nr:hypothetical protein [uncultured Paracoccus sp.]
MLRFLACEISDTFEQQQTPEAAQLRQQADRVETLACTESGSQPVGCEPLPF